MRIILKPMGAFVIVATLLLLAMGTLYGISGRSNAFGMSRLSLPFLASKSNLSATPKLVTIPEMLTATRLPQGFALSPQAQVYQAEEAKLVGPLALNHNGTSNKDVGLLGGKASGQAMTERKGAEVPGYSGRGFADYQNYTDDYVEWSVSVPADGVYRLIFRYASKTERGVRTLKVTHGGAKGLDEIASEKLVFPNLASWSEWSMVSTTARLKAGVNKVRATACNSSGPNIDALIVDR